MGRTISKTSSRGQINILAKEGPRCESIATINLQNWLKKTAQSVSSKKDLKRMQDLVSTKPAIPLSDDQDLTSLEAVPPIHIGLCIHKCELQSSNRLTEMYSPLYLVYVSKHPFHPSKLVLLLLTATAAQSENIL